MQKFLKQGQLYNIGIKLTDFYALSHQQRKLINWIRQQGSCSLLNIAIHFCQDEKTIFKMIVPLVKKRFLQQIIETDGLYYRVILPPRRRRKVPAKLIRKYQKKERRKKANEEESS